VFPTGIIEFHTLFLQNLYGSVNSDTPFLFLNPLFSRVLNFFYNKKVITP
jgi:hypothetical protein